MPKFVVDALAKVAVTMTIEADDADSAARMVEMGEVSMDAMAPMPVQVTYDVVGCKPSKEV